MGKRRKGKKKDTAVTATESLAEASPEALAVVRDSRYRRTAPVAGHLPLLEELEKLDIASEEVTTKAAVVAVVLLPLAVGAAFGGWILCFGPQAHRFPLLARMGMGAASVALAIGFAFHAVRAWRAAHGDIPDGLRDVLLPVLKGLPRHLPAEAEVDVEVDLTGVHGPGKTVFDTDAGLAGSFRTFFSGKSESRHEDPWGLVEVPVEGKGTLAIRFQDEYQRLSRQEHDATRSSGYRTVVRWNKIARAVVSLDAGEGAEAREPVEVKRTLSGDSPPEKGVAPSQVLKAAARLLRS